MIISCPLPVGRLIAYTRINYHDLKLAHDNDLIHMKLEGGKKKGEHYRQPVTVTKKGLLFLRKYRELKGMVKID